MKTVEKNIPHSRPLPQALLSYLPDKRLAVFDIETTGLSPVSHRIILTGIALIRPDGLCVRQYFAESLSDERSVLEAFCRDAADVDLFFSYNGDSFDIPFIRRRCHELGIDFSPAPEQSVDLYRILRGTYFKTMLPDLRQKTVEKLFSQDRTDDLGSAQCVTLYQRYLRGQDADNAARTILLHNYDDVRLLYEMMQVFAKIDVHALMFSRGFFVSVRRPDAAVPFASIHIRHIRMQHGYLSFQAYAPAFHIHRDIFLPGFHFIVDPARNCFLAELPFQQERGISYLDLTALALDKACESLPGFHSGFLILCEGDEVNYLSTNRFIGEFLCKTIDDYGIL